MAEQDQEAILASLCELEAQALALARAIDSLRRQLTQSSGPECTETVAARAGRADPIPLTLLSHHPIADETTLSIRWRGRVCQIGPILPFRLFCCLAHHSNRYLTHRELLDQVWGKPVSAETVRGTVHDLRRRLARAQMKDLAARIDGSRAGRYALLLGGDAVGKNPTQFQPDSNAVSGADEA